MQDKTAKEYIDDLTLDRKVEILNASEKETTESSAIVYESLDEKEKEILDYKLTDDIGINTLESTSAYQEDIEKSNEETVQESIQTEEIKEAVEQIVEDKTNEQDIEKEELKEQEDKKEQIQPELQQVTPEEQLEKLSIIGNGTNKVSIVSNPDIVKEFQNEKEKTEEKEIQEIVNNFNNQKEVSLEELHASKKVNYTKTM